MRKGKFNSARSIYGFIQDFIARNARKIILKKTPKRVIPSRLIQNTQIQKGSVSHVWRNVRVVDVRAMR